MKLQVLRDEGVARAVWGPRGARVAMTHTESRLTEQVFSRVLLVIRILREVVDFLAHPSEGSCGHTSQETLIPSALLDVPHGASKAAALEPLGQRSAAGCQ